MMVVLSWSSDSFKYFDGLSVTGMTGMTGSFDYCVESAVFVYAVFNSSDGSIGFVEGVFTVGNVSFAGFFVGVDVTSLVVFYTVCKVVFGWCL